MKLRIKGNSIRLRLLRSEVERFAADGSISDEIRFGPNGLRYTVVMSPEAESILAQFDNGEITISVPETAARRWASSDEVGFETQQEIGPDQSLAIIVEKDFECIDRPDDPDRADAFPNPGSECGSI
ncbi:MAG: hypothetical protein ABI857_10980 [Acidobacteriota bacterium]